MISGWRLVVAALVVALAQIGFLGWIIAGRAAVLRSGREIVLKVEPVDPRDLLRGDYVRLGYEISNIPVKLITGLPAGRLTSEDGSLYVRVKKGDDGYWHPVSAAFGAEPAAAASPDEADVKGHVSEGWSLEGEGTIGVDYGLDRFYLPEGEGLALQNDMRVRPFGVRVALAPDGTPQIKTLLDGDKPLYEEPLY
jgi:uncharacterized membrane-anchored protein